MAFYETTYENITPDQGLNIVTDILLKDDFERILYSKRKQPKVFNLDNFFPNFGQKHDRARNDSAYYFYKWSSSSNENNFTFGSKNGSEFTFSFTNDLELKQIKHNNSIIPLVGNYVSIAHLTLPKIL